MRLKQGILFVILFALAAFLVPCADLCAAAPDDNASEELLYGEEDLYGSDSSEVGYEGSVDMDYEGAVDIYTGTPAYDNEVSAADQVVLPDGSIYDRNAHTFNFTVSEDGKQMYCSSANGMITTTPVSIECDEGLSVILYKDGKKYSNDDISTITDAGSYAVTYSDGEQEQQVMTFIIVSEKTGKISSYTLPAGFRIESVSRNGALQPVYQTGLVDFSAEGEYRVSYRCTASGISYTLAVIIDHTPPDVTYEGVENGVARGPVTLNGLEEGDTVSVLIGEESVDPPAKNVFRAVGKYTVTVTDDAGNYVTDKFRIQLYLNFQGILFGVLALAVFASAGIYMYVSRKRLRVR